jgi:hypothetical protein
MSIASLANPSANPQQLSGMLSRLSPQQLQQYAQAHQDDMMVVSMVMAEQSRRKKDTTSMQGAQPEPTPVKDQVLAQGLPENSGIAQLPAPNMQRMAGGGIVAFADTGAVKAKKDPAAYRAYALEQAQARGLPLEFVDAIFRQESGYDPAAKNPNSSATGIGQLTKATGRSLGLKDEEFTDPYKNIDASLTFISTLNKKYKGDPSIMAMAYHDGETLADKHLAANQGVVNRAQLKPEAQGYLAKVVGSVIPSAQAATPVAGLAGTPQAQAGEVHTPGPSAGFNRRAERTWGEVPAEALANTPKSAGNLFSSLGQIVQHPLDTLGNVADVGAGAFQHALPDSWTNRINSFGTPEEQALAKKQREAASAAGQFFMDRFGSEQGIKETLATDPVGVAGDVAGLFAGGAGAARRLAALGGKRKLVQTANAAVTGAEGLQDAAAIKQAEAAAAAAKAQGVMGPQKLLSTEPAGALPPTKDAVMRAELNARQNARQLAQVRATEDAAAASGLAATEAGATAAAARTAAEADIAAAKAPMVVAPLPKKLKGLAGAAAAAKLPEMFDPDAPTKDTTPAEDLSKWDKKTAIDVAKATVPPEERKKTGFGEDDWMMLGLQLLANNTANTTPFMALGKAGVATLANRKEQQNQEFINTYRAAEARKAEAEAKYYGSDTRQMAAANKEGNEAFDNWRQGLSKIEQATMPRDQIEAMRQKLMKEAFAMYNLVPPAGVFNAGAPSAGNSTFVMDPTGTKLIPRG